MTRRIRKRRNSRHDVETYASAERALNSKSGTVGTSFSDRASLECCEAQRERRRGARVEKQSSHFCSAAQCAGFGAGDAGSAIESLATSLWQPDCGRYPEQQPYYGRGIEQPKCLYASRRWRYGEPTHHRLRAHDE